MAQTQYCTPTDVNLLLSGQGVALRVDDDGNTVVNPSGQTVNEAVNDAIEEASTEIDFYCLSKYGAALSTSLWVTKQCRVLAAVALSTRRGNPIPEGLVFRYERTIAALESIQTGRVKIPGLAERKTAVPVLSNQRAALSPLPRVVTEPGRSTGTPQGYVQPQPFYDPYALYGDEWYL
jgi:phage gp36-like protein